MNDISQQFMLSGTPPISKEDFVYETLKEAILSGQLPPGKELIQTEIAKSLGVSAIPVRSAINHLSTEGLVTQEQHRPSVVSELSTQGLEEILVIRMYLELLAIKEAAGRIDENGFSKLDELIKEMDNAIKKKEYFHYGLLNKCFHLAIYEACSYPLLRQMIKDLWDNSDRYRSRSMFVLFPELASTSHGDHIRLLAVLRKGDSEEASRLMDIHKTRARELFLHSKDIPHTG